MYEEHLADLAESDADQAARMRSQIEAELATYESRLSDVERRILDLENRILAARRELSGLQEYVDDGFGQ
jgi:predicted component of type VI protein secretion system